MGSVEISGIPVRIKNGGGKTIKDVRKITMRNFLRGLLLSAGLLLSVAAGEKDGNVKEPYFLNITPLLPGHEAELAADIAAMAESGSITHNAFIFTLNPGGAPPVDKAAILGKR